MSFCSPGRCHTYHLDFLNLNFLKSVATSEGSGKRDEILTTSFDSSPRAK